MFELVAPDAARREGLLDAHREWGPGLHEDGFGIAAEDDLETIVGFTTWLDRIRTGAGQLWWVVDGDDVLGGIALRADGDRRVAEHGHLGYGVRPSARGRGVASWAVAEVLDIAREAKRCEVVATCFDNNTASIRTIEKCGGRLASTVDRGGVCVRRYLFGFG